MPQVPRPGPHFYRRPRTPDVPGRERTFEVKGRELRPLAGPEIPIEDEQAEDFEARFQAWHSFSNGSRPEFIVWEFLTVDKKQLPDLDFVYQYPIFGGRTQFGGYLLDFFLVKRQSGWRVQGEQFHLLTPKSRARDAISKVQLTHRGIKVIDLWEDDLLNRPDFVLNTAWDRDTGVASGVVL